MSVIGCPRSGRTSWIAGCSSGRSMVAAGWSTAGGSAPTLDVSADEPFVGAVAAPLRSTGLEVRCAIGSSAARSTGSPASVRWLPVTGGAPIELESRCEGPPSGFMPNGRAAVGLVPGSAGSLGPSGAAIRLTVGGTAPAGLRVKPVSGNPIRARAMDRDSTGGGVSAPPSRWASPTRGGPSTMRWTSGATDSGARISGIGSVRAGDDPSVLASGSASAGRPESDGDPFSANVSDAAGTRCTSVACAATGRSAAEGAVRELSTSESSKGASAREGTSARCTSGESVGDIPDPRPGVPD